MQGLHGAVEGSKRGAPTSACSLWEITMCKGEKRGSHSLEQPEAGGGAGVELLR